MTITLNKVLKGSPKWSIDSDGVLSVQTTWICYNASPSNKVIDWLNLQSSVETFAGKPGDKYKMPKHTEVEGDDRPKPEITEYDESDLFIVQDVSYTAAEGRTHFEVTFNNIQNFSTLTQIGGIEASSNENNERTKSIRYKVNIANDVTYSDLTGLMDSFKSGTVVAWAGDSYLIESTDYTGEKGDVYNISITAKDMSQMMIGLPDIQTDNFGNKTATVVWRYSNTAFDEDNLPKQGDDASTYIGNREGYIVQQVNCEHHGVLGYHVTITAVSHRLGVRISSTRRDTKNDASGKFYTEWESKFQTSGPDASSTFGNAIEDIAVDDVLPSGYSISDGKITEVSYDEYITGKYNVSVKVSNAPEDTDVNLEVGANDWDADLSQQEFTLDMEQCGWAKSPSGELYSINFPPATTFTYLTAPRRLLELQLTTGGTVPSKTEAALLSTIKSRGKIGYDRIVGVQGFKNDKLVWFTPKDLSALTSIDDIQNLLLEGYVHAQPEMTTQGNSERNLLFRLWEPRKSCPLWFSAFTTSNDRYYSLHKDMLKYKFQYHAINVTMRYNKKFKSAIKDPCGDYYSNAIKKIKNSNYTSYKGAGISFRKASQSGGEDTEVTCTIHALLASNRGTPEWNNQYDSSYVEKQ